MRNMKTITTLFALALAFAAHAERLILKYPATVTVVDDSGKRTGTKRLKAGTEITICESTSTETQTAANAGSSHDKPSGIPPAQFLAERITKNTKFVAVGTLEPDPPIFDDARISTRTHWSASLGVYGANRRQHELMWGYAMKSSDAGKALYKILKDGEQHKLLITIRSFVNTKSPNEVEITAVKELSEDNPLIKALLATPY